MTKGEGVENGLKIDYVIYGWPQASIHSMPISVNPLTTYRMPAPDLFDQLATKFPIITSYVLYIV